MAKHKWYKHKTEYKQQEIMRQLGGGTIFTAPHTGTYTISTGTGATWSTSPAFLSEGGATSGLSIADIRTSMDVAINTSMQADTMIVNPGTWDNMVSISGAA